MIGKSVYTKTFEDSYKIIPSSIENIAKSYKLDTQKLKFPYLFKDSDSKMNYQGNKPDNSYYDKSIKETNTIKERSH